MGLQKHCVQSARAAATCYRYNFEQFNSSLTSAFSLFLPFTGPTHGTELPYLFNVNTFATPFIKTKSDRRVIHLTTTLWTNFVKFGDPNDKEFGFAWKPVSRENPEQHLAIRDNTIFKEKLDVGYYDKLLPVLEAFYATLSASKLPQTISQNIAPNGI